MLGLLQIIIILAVLAVAYYFVVRTLFKDEITAAMERDPAATNQAEIIFTYSGLHAFIYYKMAHAVWGWGVPFCLRCRPNPLSPFPTREGGTGEVRCA